MDAQRRAHDHGLFLTKDLLIDWRWGENFYAASTRWGSCPNNGGWQWVAGTGTDAAPYFRVFNPVLQGMKYDLKVHMCDSGCRIKKLCA
jgi:deoxyribodipyrimidine photolyase